jgi:hypothetical protein
MVVAKARLGLDEMKSAMVEIPQAVTPAKAGVQLEIYEGPRPSPG